MGGGYHILTNLHLCKTRPCLLCAEMCRWKRHFNLFFFFLFSRCTSFCRSYPGCQQGASELWLMMIQTL